MVEIALLLLIVGGGAWYILGQRQGLDAAAAQLRRDTVVRDAQADGGQLLFDGSVAEVESPHPATPKRTRGTETVLLVEDEELVRLMLVEVLKAADYNVLDARHGADALELAERHTGPIDLLVTDMTMPGFSGSELAKRLAGPRPKMHVLFISGYTDEEAAHLGKVNQPVQFLQKPFHPDAFLTKTRQILDQKRKDGSVASN